MRDKTDAEILELVDPIMDNLMGASTEINYEKHIRDFSPRLKKILSAEYFVEICKKYQAEKGVFSERKLIGIFRRQNGVAVLWTQKFSKLAGDFVAEILVIQDGENYLVDHVMVW